MKEMQTAIIITKDDLVNLVRQEAMAIYQQVVEAQLIDDPVMTVREASEFLNISEDSVRKARRKGRLEGHLINEKSWGFLKSELERYRKRYKRNA